MKPRAVLLFAMLIVALWLLRCVTAQTFRYYGFIPLNIFLAAVPLLLEPALRWVHHQVRGYAQSISLAVVGFVWLIFIPNAFYILTDFMHLNPDVLVNARDDSHHRAVQYVRGDGQYMLDSLLIFAATAFGAYVGGVALLHAYDWLQSRMSQIKARLVLAGIMLLSGVGVYVGRFGRWNSWQGLLQPWRIMSDLTHSLSTTRLQHRFLLVVLTSFIFEGLCIWLLAQHQRSSSEIR